MHDAYTEVAGQFCQCVLTQHRRIRYIQAVASRAEIALLASHQLAFGGLKEEACIFLRMHIRTDSELCGQSEQQQLQRP